MNYLKVKKTRCNCISFIPVAFAAPQPDARQMEKHTSRKHGARSLESWPHLWALATGSIALSVYIRAQRDLATAALWLLLQPACVSVQACSKCRHNYVPGSAFVVTQFN